ncbi:MAG: hypothetical protein DDT20_00832 [Firmicutes bacterium]|nr:hypothetical protein [Bacillota bacterium]
MRGELLRGSSSRSGVTMLSEYLRAESPEPLAWRLWGSHRSYPRSTDLLVDEPEELFEPAAVSGFRENALERETV